MSDIKKELCRLADKYQPLLNEIADYIHQNPELGCEEHKAAAFLQNILADHGFTISNKLAGNFPTAFKATKVPFISAFWQNTTPCRKSVTAVATI